MAMGRDNNYNCATHGHLFSKKLDTLLGGEQLAGSLQGQHLQVHLTSEPRLCFLPTSELNMSTETQSFCSTWTLLMESPLWQFSLCGCHCVMRLPITKMLLLPSLSSMGAPGFDSDLTAFPDPIYMSYQPLWMLSNNICLLKHSRHSELFLICLIFS